MKDAIFATVFGLLFLGIIAVTLKLMWRIFWLAWNAI